MSGHLPSKQPSDVNPPVAAAHSMRHDLERAFVEHWPPDAWRDTRLLVAVSGGADSVALLRAVHRLAPIPQRIDVAHFNHGWRGRESDADEQFVVELCRQLGLRLNLGRVEEQAAGRLPKTEEAARDRRYAFLIETAYAVGARYVLVGHTANDRVETLLHHLFRGTGLSGVCAPPLLRPLDQELVLVRPLLYSTRAQVEDYLRQLDQPFRSDSSNQDANYRRNFLRHQLLPRIREQYGPQVDERLFSFSELAEATLVAQQALAAQFLSEIEQLAASCHAPAAVRQLQRDGITFPNARLHPTPWPIVQQALQQTWKERQWPLQQMTRGHWELIRNMWQSTSTTDPKLTCKSTTTAAYQLPGDLQLGRIADWIVIRPRA